MQEQASNYRMLHRLRVYVVSDTEKAVLKLSSDHTGDDRKGTTDEIS